MRDCPCGRTGGPSVGHPRGLDSGGQTMLLLVGQGGRMSLQTAIRMYKNLHFTVHTVRGGRVQAV